jgi:8-oxo-dGTP pyrophosphatase MutT (NUDIX family)
VSLLDRIEACRRWTPEDYLPFLVDGRRVGRVRRDFAPQLESFDEVLDLGDAAVALKARYTDFEARSAAMHEVVLALNAAGVKLRLRDEDYAVHADWSEPPLLRLERGAVPLFGTCGLGIHVNGFVRKDDGLHLWVGRRAKDKATAPGKLDHIVAGGQPYGLSLQENLIKESAEEASIPADLAARGRPVGAVSYITEMTEGLRHDLLYCYDLELPADFEPVCSDGEVEEFFLWPLDRVLEVLEAGDDFKFNVALVNIDFLIRHGVIGPERPDYPALVHGLRLPG